MANFKQGLKALMLTALVSWTQLTWASGVDVINRRYQLVRAQSGQVIKIVDRGLSYTPDIKKDVWQSFEAFKNLLQKKSNKSDVSDQQLLSDAKDIFYSPEESVQINPKLDNLVARLANQWHYKNQNKALESMQIEKANVVLDEMQAKIQKRWSSNRYNTVAYVLRPGYFYKRKIFRTIIRQAIGQLKNVLPASQVLDWAIYFVKRYEEYLYETRVAHQYRLQYYLLNYSSQDWQMTEKERLHALSSIQEAQISWYNIFKYFKAKKHWDDFGLDEIQDDHKKAVKRQNKYSDHFQTIGASMSPCHNYSILKNEQPVIADFCTKKSILDGRYSMSFYFNKPKHVLRKRLYYELVLIAYDFLPLPPFLGTILSEYTGSKLHDQVRLEGSIAGYYEDRGDSAMHDKIQLQAINPVSLGFDRAWRAANSSK